jgi:hypothetical protein
VVLSESNWKICAKSLQSSIAFGKFELFEIAHVVQKMTRAGCYD